MDSCHYFLYTAAYRYFFSQKIDGLFRMKVAAVYPQECRVETESVIELDGEEIPVTTEEVYLSLPAAAVHDGMVFVLETKRCHTEAMKQCF